MKKVLVAVAICLGLLAPIAAASGAGKPPPIIQCTDPSGVCEPQSVAVPNAGPILSGYHYCWDNEFSGSAVPGDWTEVIGQPGSSYSSANQNDTLWNASMMTVSDDELHLSTVYGTSGTFTGMLASNLWDNNVQTCSSGHTAEEEGVWTVRAQFARDTDGGTADLAGIDSQVIDPQGNGILGETADPMLAEAGQPSGTTDYQKYQLGDRNCSGWPHTRVEDMTGWHTYQLQVDGSHIYFRVDGTTLINENMSACDNGMYGGLPKGFVQLLTLANQVTNSTDRQVNNVDWVEYDACNSDNANC